MVKTKIICTLGPSSENTTVLRKMMLAGMDVARLNFSHASHKEHLSRINLIRKLNKKYRRRIKILQDLEGYRIRIGTFRDRSKSIELKKRQTVYLSNQKKANDRTTIPFDYEGPLGDIKRGAFIYIDDGNIALRVKSTSKSYVQVEVVTPGILKENKGVNIPGIKLSFKDLTEKDKKDLQFGLKNKMDFIAQSFVRNKKDVLNVKEFVNYSNVKPRIIAKIENREGIKNIDEILEVADGIMIARGDMGVSLPIYEVPMMQKMIIKKCIKRKKMVITATQMLESMTEHKRPTRAEVSDIANAILDGSGYLMLSGETAIGAYPALAVKMMNDIIKFTEYALKRRSNN
ncbi:MAG: pyruvate kinase [Candidatus Omnitrophica bacterium]|nr:pyruvate kinase [Candidatus Omnitrophota bacterium]